MSGDQLEMFETATQPKARKESTANRVDAADARFHEWYRFVLSFPPHLVREYFSRYGVDAKQTVLDPFCGTGTTLVEAKLLGVPSIGIEANPVAHFASSVKLNWEVDPDRLARHAKEVMALAESESERLLKRDRWALSIEQEALLLKDSISAIPLHRTLVLLDKLKVASKRPYYSHELLAVAKSVVESGSNLHFGPEVGVRRKKRADAPVEKAWYSQVCRMASDLKSAPEKHASSVVHLSDARSALDAIEKQSVDFVFTSPPYPNEKDYTRTTRLESVLLGFMQNKADLRAFKQNLMRSNTRNAYKGDDDHTWIADHPRIIAIANEIEKRRIDLGKTSGFEKLYGRVTLLYFGGMAKHLSNLRRVLKPGAHLGYVVGDQASYLQVHIPTGALIAEIAEKLGYEVVALDLFRNRFASATKMWMREEVVVLRWRGNGKHGK